MQCRQIEKTGTTLGKNEDKYILSVVKMAGKPKSRWKYCKNSQFEKNLINMQKIARPQKRFGRKHVPKTPNLRGV